MSMWEPFTEEGRNAMIAAQAIAQVHGEDFINHNHLFFALARGKRIAGILAALNVSAERLAQAEDAVLGTGSEIESQEMVFSPEAKRLVELAFTSARELGTHFIGAEHLMLGFLALGKSRSAILAALPVDVEKFHDLLVESLASQPKTIEPQPRSQHVSFGNLYERVVQKQTRERTDAWKNLEAAVSEKDLDRVLANALAAAAQERLTADEVIGRVARFIR